MSDSMYVILDSNVAPTSEQMDNHAKSLDYDAQFCPDVTLSEHSGFLPVSVDGQEAGFELFVYPLSELSIDVPSLELNDDSLVYELALGGQPWDLKAALITVFILASKFEGTAIDVFSGAVIPAEGLQSMMSMFEQM